MYCHKNMVSLNAYYKLLEYTLGTDVSKAFFCGSFQNQPAL